MTTRTAAFNHLGTINLLFNTSIKFSSLNKFLYRNFAFTVQIRPHLELSRSVDIINEILYMLALLQKKLCMLKYLKKSGIDS